MGKFLDFEVMKITVFGSGYVGLVTGACLSHFGNDVILVDIDADKIAKLESGEIPIYEPGLEVMVNRNHKAGRLRFTTQADVALKSSEIAFVAVNTPEGEDGAADLQYVEQVAQTVAAFFQNVPERKLLFVLKSTVPVGTADRCIGILPSNVEVVNNPEFLKEGAAVNDFLRPDRVVIGCKSEGARKLMGQLYAPFVRSGAPILFMSNRSAEVAKYAANSFLALKVSYINDLANFCEAAGAQIYDVKSVMSADARIGSQFLHPGSGYGGSCFPKDVPALARTARDLGCPLPLVESTQVINQRQRQVMPGRIRDFFKARKESPGVVALWGISFKAETDDIRESPAIVLMEELVEAGFRFNAYDPQAGKTLQRLHPDWIETKKVVLFPTAVDCLKGAHVLAVMTEWNEFYSPDFSRIAAELEMGAIFDGKNIYKDWLSAISSHGLRHFGIGLEAFNP